MPLPDPSASRAVLIGVDRYDNLAGLPAVAANLDRLAALLTADDVWGLPPEHVVVLSNPAGKDEVLDAVHTAATEAEDALLVYFAGHGLLTAGADLRLALPHTDPERLYRGVAYDDVRDLIVHTGRALARVVILDCCYSGSALTGYMGADAATGIANRTMAEGTYVMTASAETKPAMAPPGEKYTAFTGELLRVIEDGVPGGPDPLPMGVLFTEVRDRLAARTGIPAPQQRARNAGHAIALVRNRWGAWAVQDGLPAEEEVTPVRPRALGRLARLLHPLLVVASVVSLPFVAASSASVGGSDNPCASLSALEVTDDCGGVSDGRHSFMPELNRVSAGIARANADIPDDEPFVTFALLVPPVVDEGDENQILHRAQGAYAAQRQINGGGTGPYVRLVLARPDMYGFRVADQLVDMAESKKHNLRAVVGFDVTDPRIPAVVKDVTDEGVPAVAGLFTPNAPGDHGLSDGRVAWIMPSADDQVSALASMQGATVKGSSILVWDMDDEGGYVQDLRNAFGEHLGDTVGHTARYSSYASDEAVERKLLSIADDLCALPDSMEKILFAGGRDDLRLFVHALGNRACPRREFTIVSGSEASSLYQDWELDWSALRGAGVTVEYTSGAHPDGTKGRAMEELRRLLERLGPTMGTVDLDDGETISAYDAMLTAAQTIRHLSGTGGKVPSTTAVGTGLRTFRHETASGSFCLDAQGRAADKTVAVLRLDPDRRAPSLVATAYPDPRGCD